MTRRALYGSYRSLEDALDRVFRELRVADPLAPILLVTPGNLLKFHLTRHLAGSVHAFSFLDLASQMGAPALHAAGRAPLPSGADLLLFRRAAPESRGLGAVVRHTVREMVAAGLTPADMPPELAQACDRVRTTIREAGFYDDLELVDAAIANAEAFFPGAPVLLYGPYDLTPAQRRLMTALLEGRDAVAFCPGPWQLDEDTLAFVRPMAEWLEGSLGFVPADFDVPEPEPAPVEVISAPHLAQEAREVARAVVGAIRRGVPTHRIAVLLRSAVDYAPAIAAALEAAGVEVYAPGVLPIAETPAARALMALLAVRTDDYQRHRVMELATSGLFDLTELVGSEHADGIAPAEWENITVRLGIVGGEQEWRARLTIAAREAHQAVEDRREAADDERGRLRLERARRYATRVEALQAFFIGLSERLAALPEAASWETLADGCVAAFRSLTSLPESEQIESRLIDLRRLAAVDERAELAEFVDVVRESLGKPLETPSKFQRGGVLVTSIMKARGLPFDEVIVPGMVEGVFPRIGREDPLLPDRQRIAINEALTGDMERPLPLKTTGPASARAEERLLFKLVTEAATERTVLTWPRADEITQRERIPSFFLLRTLETILERPIALEELRDLPPPLRWVPAGRPAPEQRDMAVTLLERDLFDITSALRTADATRAASVLGRTPFGTAAIRAECARWEDKHFTEYDGHLAEALPAEQLESCAPSAWDSLSATRLETFARCPYRYFLGQVLALGAADEPERQLTLDAGDRGRVFHAVLAEFYRGTDRSDERVLEIAARVLADYAATGVTGPPVLWEAVRRDVGEALIAYVRKRGRTEYIPRAFEQPFGWEGSSGGPRVLLGRVSFRGYIDRIDVTADGKRGRVVDYKTGKFPQGSKDDDLRGGESLQLPIYLLAARALFPDVEVWEAVYDYGTEKAGFREVRVHEHTKDDVSIMVDGFVDMMGRGRFPYRPGHHCTWCEFREVCGAGHDAAHARKADDPVWTNLVELKT